MVSDVNSPKKNKHPHPQPTTPPPPQKNPPHPNRPPQKTPPPKTPTSLVALRSPARSGLEKIEHSRTEGKFPLLKGDRLGIEL